MAKLKSLDKLLSTTVFIAAENGWLEVLELVALFLSKTGTLDAKNSGEVFVDAIFCFVKIFFVKRGTVPQFTYMIFMYSKLLFSNV